MGLQNPLCQIGRGEIGRDLQVRAVMVDLDHSLTRCKLDLETAVIVLTLVSAVVWAKLVAIGLLSRCCWQQHDSC